jgi:hypothetical protein
MLHFLTVGHLDEAAVREARLLVLRPLDSQILMRLLSQYRDEKDSAEPFFEKHHVVIDRGAVRCPWYTPRLNRTAVQFSLALADAAGCQIADVEHGRVLARADLQSLLTM